MLTENLRRSPMFGAWFLRIERKWEGIAVALPSDLPAAPPPRCVFMLRVNCCGFFLIVLGYLVSLQGQAWEMVYNVAKYLKNQKRDAKSLNKTLLRQRIMQQMFVSHQ